MAYKIFRNFTLISTTYSRNRLLSSQIRSVSNNKQQNAEITSVDDDPDKPIEYLKSKAATFRAKEGRTGAVSNVPSYQPYVISISLSVFMLYFFILREESDIDTEFDKSLYQRVGGLEKQNLEVVLDYNRKQGLSTTDIEKRLEEIRQESSK